MRKFLPILLVLLMAIPAMAQQARGRIIGTVTTSDGAVIPGVKVTIASDALIAREMTTMSNERGQFRFVLLPVGSYGITMEKDGYAMLKEEDIVVDFNQTITLDKVLQASAGGQTITITGEAPIVDKTSSSKGDKLDLEFLQNTPNQRNVFALPNLSAGFTDDSGLGGVQDAGNAFMVDGVNVSDPSTSTSFTTMNLEAVEQVDVNLFGSNAEYGSFTGAALNVITKSGGNDFSGEANFFMRRVDWVGDNTEDFQQYGITAPTGEDVNDPNFSLGGPILQDKVWFFANYNYLDRTIVQNIMTGAIDEVRETNQFYGKISARWDDRNISYVSYLRRDFERSHRFPQAFFSQNLLLESNMFMQESKNDMIFAQHSIVLTDSLILEGRVSIVDASFDIIPRQQGPTVLSIASSQFIGEPGNSRQDLNTRDTDSYLVTADYYVDDFAGQHSFKAGFEHESNLAGRAFTWSNLWFVQDLDGSFDGLQAGDFRQDFGDVTSLGRVNRYGGFVQDSWSVNDRLTLNLGVRVDDHSLKADDLSVGAPLGSDEVLGFTDAAPRIGFAYDLFGDGKTVLRGFFGRFYEDVVTGNTESLLAQADPTRVFRYDGTDWVLLQESGGTGNFFVDDDISNQYTQGVMLGVEQQLTEDIAGGITFVYKKDEDLLGTTSTDATWDDPQQIDFSNDNGSYSGIWYPNVNSGVSVYGNPQEGDNGVLGELNRKYYGMIFEINKRMSDRYSVRANYTYSRNSGTGSQASGSLQGFTGWSNPNSWINADGRAGLERPHVFKVSGTYIAPFDIYVSPFFTWQSGVPKGDTLGLVDNFGTVVIGIEPTGGADGDHRFDNQMNIDLRIEKAFVIMDRYRLGLIVDVFNLTNDDSVTGRQSTRINSSVYDLPDTIVDPREYQVGVRLIF